MSTTVDVRGLHAALDAARKSAGWSWRQLARELDLSPSTMSRLANGHKPDLDAFAVMVSWLRVDPQKFMVSEDDRLRREAEPEPDLMAELAPLLRARKDLKSRDVDYLEELIGSAVRRFQAEGSGSRG